MVAAPELLGMEEPLGLGWNTGTQAQSTTIGTMVKIDHRTWSSPALADIDGDATLDIVLGDTAISTALADVRPLLDGRAKFNQVRPIKRRGYDYSLL